MNTQELIALHENLCDKARALMKRKNHDYSGMRETFANFERVRSMGICAVHTGFFVRMCDKFSRLITLAEEGIPHVTDESVADTLVDMINYPILYAGWLIEQREKQESTTNYDRSKSHSRQSQCRDAGQTNHIPTDVPPVHSRRSNDASRLQQKRRKQQGDSDKALSRRGDEQPGDSVTLGRKSKRNAGSSRAGRSRKKVSLVS